MEHDDWAAAIEAALRALPQCQRGIFPAICTEATTYARVGARFGIDAATAEREFAASLVALAAALER